MPPSQPTDPISSRELSFRTFGNDGTGEGRRRKAFERAADSRSALKAKRRAEAKIKPNEVAHFLFEVHNRLLTIAAKQMRAGRPDATRANSILFRTVRSQSSGFVAIHPSAESAAFLAAWLRSPGVDEFCPALTQLDLIAGAAAPQGRPVDVLLSDLTRSLATLERAGAADAVAAARLMRTAGIVGCHARFYATPEAAAPMADTLHALGISRSLVNSLDQIAGRPEPRPH